MLPAFLVENLGSLVQFPAVVLTGSEEATGHEAYHVANGRRDSGDYWSAITPNNPSYLNYVLDRTRAADMVALDRGHNLAGAAVSLLCSNDNWGTSETVFTATIPTTSIPGTSLDAANGCTTEEGAWIKRFPLRAAKYWRWSIPALGANITAQVVGLYLGKGFYSASQSDWLFTVPTSPDGGTLQGVEAMSEAGWAGRGLQTERREGAIPIKLVSYFNYDLARYHLQALFGFGRPMWIVFDDSQTERSFLAIRPQPQFGFSRQQQWAYPQASVPYQEHEPLRA